MSVSAYGSLISLSQVLVQIQKLHDWGRIHLHIQQVQNFQETVRFLQEFLELHSQKMSKDIGGFARRITHAAREAETIIDDHIVDQLRGIHDVESDKGLSSFSADLMNVIQEMESIKKELPLVSVDRRQWPLGSFFSTLGNPESKVLQRGFDFNDDRTSMVGSEDLINQILAKLMSNERSLEVIPIVGMGGIGKTTLARRAFEDSRTVNRFDILKWCTISQQYKEREVIQGLLGGKSNEGMRELGVRLHQDLVGRRYLIIIDDMWSVKVWEKLKLFFPENRNGSRVIVTTRLSNVADSLGSRGSYQMDFLNDAQSWDLFCESTFGQQSCPIGLEQFGKKIAASCGGLPISIVTIGGLLSKSNMTPEYWEFVAKNVAWFISSGDDDRCLKILYLSYDSLPIHLKLCFLDFKNYPEDKDIPASRLIQDWISLGLIKSVPGKRIKDIAEEYLKELTERNLILIRERKFTGKIKSYGIHDLLRELCKRESHAEKLICNPGSRSFVTRENVEFGLETYYFLSNSKEVRRKILLCGISQWFRNDFCFLCGAPFGLESVVFTEILTRSTSNATRASVCGRCKVEYSHLMESRWVAVLGEGSRYSTQSRLVHSESDVVTSFISPTPILFLWNLQTIYISSRGVRCDGEKTLSETILPVEIWEMRHLRHLIVPYCVLPVPAIWEKDFTVLEELQTIKTYKLRCARTLIRRIPNIRELKISYDLSFEVYSRHCLDNVAFLHQLESLTIQIGDVKSIRFPRWLKKLCVIGCHLCCEDMDVIGSLSDLQVLNLQDCYFENNTWSPVKGKFLQLKVLKILVILLIRWEAEQDHFPKLERLRVDVSCMEVFPSDIANIPTLISIDFVCWRRSGEKIELAKEILEEQQSLGNCGLKIYVNETRCGNSRRYQLLVP